MNRFPPLRSPLRWAGGKSSVSHLVARALPHHFTYVEPFGGAASVLLAKSPSPVEIYNDLDGELVNFFRVVQENPQGFLQRFRWALIARSEYERLANLDPSKLTPIERAYRFYYLVMAGWGAESGRFRFQVSARGDSGRGNRLIGALAKLEERILPVHERFRKVIIEERPWQEILARYDDPDTFFYLDPPYPGHRVHYGVNMPGLEEHRELWKTLASIKGQWLLSSYDDPDLLEEMKVVLGKSVRFYPLRVRWGLRPGCQKRAGREILASNYSLPQRFLRANLGALATPQPLFTNVI